LFLLQVPAVLLDQLLRLVDQALALGDIIPELDLSLLDLAKPLFLASRTHVQSSGWVIEQ
jgi:hypothetical protein